VPISDAELELLRRGGRGRSGRGEGEDEGPTPPGSRGAAVCEAPRAGEVEEERGAERCVRGAGRGARLEQAVVVEDVERVEDVKLVPLGEDQRLQDEPCGVSGRPPWPAAAWRGASASLISCWTGVLFAK